MMIKELRIGNWVKTSTPGMKVFIPHLDAQVQAIGLGGNVSFYHTPEREGFEIYSKFLAGICLTEKWLNDFGFKLKRNRLVLEYASIEILYFSDGIWVRMGANPFIIPRIHYVHQLQNLYFSLTGEELTIKL